MRSTWVRFMAAVALSLAVAGCQSTSSETPAAAPPEEANPPSAETEQEPDAAEEVQGITQEPADIKFRIEMPEINDFLEISEEGPIVPALKQDAVPQGLTYMPEQNWLVMSSYREDGTPSILAVIDVDTQKLVKAVELYLDEQTPYTGHAGGVTVSRDHLWVSSGQHAYWLKKEDVIAAEDGATLIFEGSIQTDTRASFTFYGDGILWVGEYAQGTNYPTEKSHHMKNRDGEEHRAWAVGFYLDEETDLLPEEKEQPEGTPITPDLILSLPNMVQGMLKSEHDVWLSRSYGRNNASTLDGYMLDLTEEPHTTVAIGEETVPLWFLDNQNKTAEHTLPPMSEGIVDHEGTMYILFESAASKYVTSSSYPLDRILIWKWK